jgi:hypothetical protein
MLMMTIHDLARQSDQIKQFIRHNCTLEMMCAGRRDKKAIEREIE